MKMFLDDDDRRNARSLFRLGLGWEDVAVKLGLIPTHVRGYMRRLVRDGFFDRGGHEV